MKKPRSFSTLNLKLDAQKKELAKKIKPLDKRQVEKGKKEEKDVVEAKILYPQMPFIANTVVGILAQKTYKLKITATDIQCIRSSDRDKKDDYEINQSILYKAKGQMKRPTSRNIKRINHHFKSDEITKFDNVIHVPIKGNVAYTDPSGEKSNFHYKKLSKDGANKLIYVYGETQIHVDQGNSRNLKNIDNSMIFNVTQEELNDKNAEMIIYTLVSERNSKWSGDTIHYNYDGQETYVAIKDVLDILTGARKLNPTKTYFDEAIAKGIKFDHFDGFKLPLTKVDYPNKIILEGPIRARGNTAANKAAVWMRFELVD